MGMGFCSNLASSGEPPLIHKTTLTTDWDTNSSHLHLSCILHWSPQLQHYDKMQLHFHIISFIPSQSPVISVSIPMGVPQHLFSLPSDSLCHVLRGYAGFSHSLSKKNDYLSSLLFYCKRTTHKTKE